MDKFKVISHQTAWQLLGKLSTTAASIVVLGLLSRKFHEEGAGLFTLVLTYLSFFYLIVDFGLNAHFMSALLTKGAKVQLDKLFGLRFVWGVFLTLLAIGLSLILPLNTPLFSSAVAWGAASIMGFGIYITTSALFQARLKYQYQAVTYFISSLIMIGTIVFLITNRVSLPKLLLALSTEWLVAALVGLILVKNILRLRFIIDLRFIFKTFKATWPLSLTLLLNLVYFRVDSFIISSTRGIAEVGIYNLSYSIFQTILVLPSFIMNSFYPMMVKNRERIDFLPSLKKVNLSLLGLGLFTSAITFSLSSVFINILSGGKGFIGSTPVLQILSLSFPAFFCSALFSLALIALKKYYQALVIYSAGLIFNLTLNFIFIPTYSYLAASVITVFSEYFILLLQLVYLRRI